MLEAFYSHLENKSANDSELKLLRAQWDFDKLLLESALQHVGGVFRHYSKHDGSHSRKILVNIAKLLGNKLQLLSATDTWLIMEGAFWHDTGMLTSDEEIIETVKTPEFTSFIRGIARDKGHELNCLAQHYNPDDPLWYFKKADNPTVAVDQWYQLLASWYRGQHAFRSGYTVLHPETRGIESGRSSLIPQRLLRCLSKICRMHTAPFDQIRIELQQFEDGMSNELCHPRFVACLLRLGDLLDMDNGRFCPVMAAIHGKGPRSKVAHLDKHESIVHLRCSEQFIEAHAECDTDEGYLVTSDWFAMLEKETEKQLKIWDEIVPSAGFMSIPVVKVELRHKDTDLLLRDGRLPKLSLSENEVFEILQGADIYRDKWQSLRELLQNAEDATLVRLWLCHEKEIREGGVSPLNETFLGLLQKYPINIELRRAPDDNGNTILHVAIEDKGCGISRESFEKMLLVGSGKDGTLQNVIDGMPEWLKPSGAFGLGLQSAFFMGAQKLEFSTRSLLDNSSAHITIPSQLGTGSFAKYKSESYKPGADYGSTLSFSLVYRDDFAESVREHFGRHRFRSRRVPFVVPDPLKEKDDFLHDPVLQAIVFEIKNFSEGCFGQLKLKCDDRSESLEKICFDTRNFWFDTENNILLPKLPENIENKRYFSAFARIFYRGQRLSSRIFINWIGKIDVLYGCAKDALTISRNELKENFRQNIANSIYMAMFNYICANYDSMSESQKMFVSIYSDRIESISKKTFPAGIARCNFESIMFGTNGNRIYDVLNEEDDFILCIQEYMSDNKHLVAIKRSGYDGMKIYTAFGFASFLYVINLLVQRKLYVKGITNESYIYSVSKNKHKYVCDSDNLCFCFESSMGSVMPYNCRLSMPCSSMYRDLAVVIPNFGVQQLFDIEFGEENMILPYKFVQKEGERQVQRENFDLYVNWVYNNSISDPKPEKSIILDRYYDFVEYFENEVMKDSEKWKKAFISEPIHKAVGVNGADSQSLLAIHEV